jgi:hypothetical protein
LGDAFDSESFVPLLERMRDILLKHDYIDQATLVDNLIDLAHLESSDFPEKLGGGDMWGSSGSVADVVDLQSSFDPVDAERDSIELTESLVRLADRMKAQGISSERVEFLADAFRRGLETRHSRSDPWD